MAPSDDDDVPCSIPVSADHLRACSFATYYPQFRDTTIPTVVVPLDDTFIDYLHRDDFIIPQHVYTLNAHTIDQNTFHTNVVRAMFAALRALGGCGYPQLNWSAPSDAAWIAADRTLRCDSVADIILLLKSSERVTQQITRARSHDIPLSLALRRYSTLSSAAKYRAFVADKRVIALCQKDVEHDAIRQTERHKRKVREHVALFFADTVRPRFQQSHYVFDVFIDRQERTWLTHFQPWSNDTRPIHFTWNELIAIANANKHDAEVIYRTGETTAPVSRHPVIDPADAARLIVARLPSDGIDLSDAGAIESFVDRVKALDLIQHAEDDDSDRDGV